MIGVVICPITSGDTAFRSARLTLADPLEECGFVIVVGYFVEGNLCGWSYH